MPRTRRSTSLLLGVAFLGVLSLVSYRAVTKLNIPGRPDGTHWVFQDFRDSVYYPVVAFLGGHNPYDAVSFMRSYPVPRPLPLYSPLNLIIHLPFALLSFEHSELAYYVFIVLLTLLLAYLSLRFCGLPTPAPYVCGIAALVLLSRPGQMNLLLGQVALQGVIGAYVALHFARTRPWLAGLGLALSTFKPSFGLPLAVLMLCRRDTPAVVIGGTVAAVVSAAATAVLVRPAGGLAAFVHSLLDSHRGFSAQAFNEPTFSPFRIDTPALAERLLGANIGGAGELIIGIGILSLGAAVVWQLASRESPGAQEGAAGQLSTTVVCLTVLMCTYHQAYDLLLLAWPLTALVANRWTPAAARQPALRWVVLVLLALPAANYLASATAIDSLGIAGGLFRLATSLNGGALVVAFGICVALARRRVPPPPVETVDFRGGADPPPLGECR